MGVLGYYIDKKIYGRLMGFTINYLKCVYYFVRAPSYFFLFFNSTFWAQILNYFSRSYGRLVGPLVFKKIDFFKR